MLSHRNRYIKNILLNKLGIKIMHSTMTKCRYKGAFTLYISEIEKENDVNCNMSTLCRKTIVGKISIC